MWSAKFNMIVWYTKYWLSISVKIEINSRGKRWDCSISPAGSEMVQCVSHLVNILQLSHEFLRHCFVSIIHKFPFFKVLFVYFYQQNICFCGEICNDLKVLPIIKSASPRDPAPGTNDSRMLCIRACARKWYLTVLTNGEGGGKDCKFQLSNEQSRIIVGVI